MLPTQEHLTDERILSMIREAARAGIAVVSVTGAWCVREPGQTLFTARCTARVDAARVAYGLLLLKRMLS